MEWSCMEPWWILFSGRTLQVKIQHVQAVNKYIVDTNLCLDVIEVISGSFCPECICQCHLIIFWLGLKMQWGQSHSTWPATTTHSRKQAVSDSYFSAWPQLCLRAPSSMFSKYSDNGLIHFGVRSSWLENTTAKRGAVSQPTMFTSMWTCPIKLFFKNSFYRLIDLDTHIRTCSISIE